MRKKRTSKAARLFAQRVARRAAGNTSDLSSELLRAFSQLGKQLSVRGADIDTILSDENLDRVLTPFRAQLHTQVGDAVKYFGKDVPRAR